LIAAARLTMITAAVQFLPDAGAGLGNPSKSAEFEGVAAGTDIPAVNAFVSGAKTVILPQLTILFPQC